MIIALDYDHTFTADKDLWYDFIYRCFEKGHKVYIVTARSEEFDQIHDELLIGLDIIYCDGIAKKNVVAERGIKVNIWIDDNPDAIVYGSSYTAEMLAEWRINGRI